MAAQFPAGWRPDLVALWLNYTGVPDWVWSAPVPIVGLATDWNLLWHEYRQVLPFCDAVLTDEPGVDVLARAGIDRAGPAVLYGAAPDSLGSSNTAERDIDVLFVGNLHPAVQRERLPWLARLAKLAERRNVVIRTGISGDECRVLMARSRVAFNRSVRSEANMRAFEAAAAGALLFQEAGNRELPGIFAEGRECVYYGDEDLEERLEHFLDHEDERRAIAEAARVKVGSYTFSALLMKALTELWETDREGLLERARRRVLGRGRRDGDRPLDNTTGADASLLAPSPEGEGRGEGSVASQTLAFSFVKAESDRRTPALSCGGWFDSTGVMPRSAPHPSPLPRERELVLTKTRPSEPGHQLLGEGLPTPPECLTAGLLPSECAPRAQTPFKAGRTTSAGDLRSGAPSGSGDPRRTREVSADADGDVAFTLFGEGVACALSSPPDNYGEGVAGALSSPQPAFGEGVACA